MKKYLFWFLVSLFLLCGVATYAEKHTKYNLIGMGNSIGAGTFSISTKGMPTDPELPWWYMVILKMISVDSNSYLAEIEKKLENDPSIGKGWKRHNLSIPGHELRDLIRIQLPIAINLAKDKPSLIFIEAFANDVCADDLAGMTPFDEYVVQLSYMVNRIIDETDALIVLVAAPDLSAQPDMRGSDEMWWPMNWIVGRYEDLWERINLCRTITTGEHRRAVRAQLELYNVAMEAMARVHESRICFTHSSEMFEIKKHMVSKVDGFHLSGGKNGGQKALADATYPFGEGNCSPQE